MSFASGVNRFGTVFRGPSFEQRQQAFADQHAVGAVGYARGFEQRREYIHQAHRRFDDLPRPDAFAPADGQRHVQSGIVAVGLGVRERHAVVCRDDDDGTVQFAAAFQLFEAGAEVSVEPLDLDGVVEDVAADRIGIGQESRDLGFVERVSGFHPRSVFVRTVGFVSPEPEAERRSFGAFGKELAEISRVVDLRNAAVRRVETALVIFGTGRIVFPSGSRPVAGPPAFARVADVVPGLAENVGITRVTCRKRTGVRSGLLDLPGIESRQNAGPRGAAAGRGDIGVVEQRPVAGRHSRNRESRPFCIRKPRRRATTGRQR